MTKPSGSRKVTIPASDRYVAWLMVAGAAAALAGVTLYPFMMALRMSFLDIRLINYLRNPPFAELANYRALINDPFALRSALVTLGFVAATVSVQLVLGSAAALMLNHRQMPARGLVLALALLPMVISPAVAGYMNRILLDYLHGPVPWALRSLGLPAPLGEPLPAFITAVLVDTWQWAPFIMLLVFAGLRSLPAELVEAAQLDGASFWRLLWFIILPVLRPVLGIAVLLRATDAIRTFDTLYILTGGGPGSSTATVSIYLYQLFASGRFGEASAGAVLLLVVLGAALRPALRHVVS